MNKYLIIPIAIIIIVFIGVITSLFKKEDVNNMIDMKFDNISELDIDTKSITINIQNSDEFRVKTDCNCISIKNENGKLEIEENKYIVDKMRKIVYLYIPSNTIFNDVDIDIKSGLIEIDNLNTKEFEIDNMSGSIKINNLNISDNFDIDNASGTIDIENSNINNIDADIKSGVVNINSLLTGNNHIELKSGTVNLNLKGDDYRFKTTKISGIISINEEMENVNSNGNTFIDIEVISGTVNVLTKW